PALAVVADLAVAEVGLEVRVVREAQILDDELQAPAPVALALDQLLDQGPVDVDLIDRAVAEVIVDDVVACVGNLLFAERHCSSPRTNGRGNSACPEGDESSCVRSGRAPNCW